MLNDIPVTMTRHHACGSGLHSGLQLLVAKLRGLPDRDAVTCMPRAVASLPTLLLAFEISAVPPMKLRRASARYCRAFWWLGR